MLVFVVCFLFSLPSFAFLDFIGDQAKKMTEVAAYTDAVTELLGEVSPEDELSTGAKDVRRRADQLRLNSSNLKYLSRNANSVLSGSDWSSRRLETNIRSTTDYVRRLKRLMSRIAILGTDGAIALNTTETNVALNEVQRNQQAIILQNEDTRLRDFEKEQEDARQWTSFSERQRKLRKSEGAHGKL